jgi:hypothetical protein
MRDRVAFLAALATAALSLTAVARELRRPRGRRRWHGRVLGVPYDLRRPTARRLRRGWWAPDDPHLLVPRSFGVGWDVNVGRVWRLLRRR